jgi:hypothetical protein
LDDDGHPDVVVVAAVGTVRGRARVGGGGPACVDGLDGLLGATHPQPGEVLPRMRVIGPVLGRRRRADREGRVAHRPHEAGDVVGDPVVHAPRAGGRVPVRVDRQHEPLGRRQARS